MQRRALQLMTLVAIVLVSFSMARAQASSNADALTQLTTLLGNMKTASGQFEQTLTDAQGEVLQSSQGRFHVKKPGKFFWDTQAPFPQQLISDGKSLWLYDPDLEQASVSTLDEKTRQTPALLLSGDARKIGERFSVKLAADKDGNIRVYELTARDTQAAFNRISASFNGDTLTSMGFTDKLNNQTQFRFDGVRINQPISDTLFRFSPPEGTDVIHND